MAADPKDWHNHDSPDLMKDLRSLPRPVELALPPSATVIAERAALFPPARRVSGEARSEIKWHTSVASNNEVDLGT
jgi:hypothetical protein